MECKERDFIASAQYQRPSVAFSIKTRRTIKHDIEWLCRYGRSGLLRAFDDGSRQTVVERANTM